jgi:hypothetical protein
MAAMVGVGLRSTSQPDKVLLIVGPPEKELLVQADKLVGGSDAVMVIVDDTAVPKKGKHSVGVASQNASALDENANCQTWYH